MIPIPVWLRAVIGAAVLGAVLWVLEDLYQKGYKAGSEAVRVKWYAERSQQEKAWSEAIYAAQAAFRRDLAIREEVERELSAKLDAADRRGADLARRLRLAQARPLPPGPGGGPAPSSADDPGRESGYPDPVGVALAAHLSACERDATRLNELQGFIRATQTP